ncbi:MAG: hypothetical protein U5M50_08590 [Sphingobium sp.]|nr:hypothetical protein [Sphingobium sp.]
MRWAWKRARGFNLGDGNDVTAFLKRVIVSMGDLVTRDGEQVSFSDEVRDQLIGRQYLRQEIMLAYSDAVTGAELGN